MIAKGGTRDDIIYRSRHSCASTDGELPGHDGWDYRAASPAADDIRAFYKQFQGAVIVGIEACGYTNWFEELMEELGHQLLVGDAAEIRRLARRRQKNDRRDADIPSVTCPGSPPPARPPLMRFRSGRTLLSGTESPWLDQ